MFGVIMTSLIPSNINNRRYMAQILPIRRKTPYYQLINQSIINRMGGFTHKHGSGTINHALSSFAYRAMHNIDR